MHKTALHAGESKRRTGTLLITKIIKSCNFSAETNECRPNVTRSTNVLAKSFDVVEFKWFLYVFCIVQAINV